MQLEDNIYTLIKNSLNLNSASIIKEDNNYLEVDDKLAQIFYIVVKNSNATNLVEEINKNVNYEPTFSIISKERLSLTPMKPFKCFRETYQYSYMGDIKEVRNDLIKINKMDEHDLPYFKANYVRNGDDDAYLNAALKRGMLKASINDEIVGFIGEHPEHALGLLFVSEEHRRKGIGKALEQSMINEILKQNRRPIEHVVLDNEKSKKLQASIEGMELDDGFVYWLF